MAQRKPAVSTLLKQAQARIAELEKDARRMFNEGWIAAADLADRDDLRADLDDSPYYIKRLKAAMEASK